MHRARITFFWIAVAALLAFVSMPVHAYIDPGTGSAILQGILAALAAIALTAKLYWHRLLRLLGLRKRTEEPVSDATQEQGEHAEESRND
ncbi:hypothetical protein IC757_06340 [Wenzhouxiangella sp. AB-CW3]|uniref:hypothetical protein n=1 Tax=Wenzhouxiangella sp. AB-CW3 TaxID=2771012 RepID=UPI00168A54B2|nr:hypothetical protein [Wenzhouxiangella sp. AB-CW3]QOC23742.1 hypothetical protein IC757_06340 [Wenzhouxiangella sp. AB-CW3]